MEESYFSLTTMADRPDPHAKRVLYNREKYDRDSKVENVEEV